MRRYVHIARRVAAGVVPYDILSAVEEAADRWQGAATTLKGMNTMLSRGDVNGAAVMLARMSPAIRDLLPYGVIDFLESTVKKEPGTESWRIGVLRDMERILVRGGRGKIVWGPYYLTFREGTSNKFHYFAVYEYRDEGTGQMMYVGANAYGRIGTTAKIFEIARSSSKSGAISMTNDKMDAKRARGYEEE